MTMLAPPVARCTRTVELSDGRLYPCTGWVSGYVLDPAEHQAHTLTCAWCAEEYVWCDYRLVRVGTRQVPVGGRLVRVQHAATVPPPWPSEALPDYSALRERSQGQPPKPRSRARRAAR